MPHKPFGPTPDTIDPHAPPEAPRIDCPVEQPGRGTPEFSCPPDPAYRPDEAPQEQPSPDPDI